MSYCLSNSAQESSVDMRPIHNVTTTSEEFKYEVWLKSVVGFFFYLEPIQSKNNNLLLLLFI